MRLIAFINQSTQVSDDEVKQIAGACTAQLVEDVCPLWRLPTTICYLDTLERVPDFIPQLIFFDNSDVAGALGYHSNGPDGLPYGKVFTNDILGGGGGVFYDPFMNGNAISGVASHEACEMVGDPDVITFTTGPKIAQGDQYALELCDPVQHSSYMKNQIMVSNFVGPAYFNLGAGKIDWLGHLKAPFTVDSGGYQIVLDSVTGAINHVYGASRLAPHPASRLEQRKRKCP